MIAKYLLPAMAVLGSAAAQCSEATATVNSPADATGLASCKTYKGSILLTKKVAGSVDLTGIERITGDLIAENNGELKGISSSSIATIEGEFKLNNLTGLETLELTKFNTVGSISWTSLTALSGLSFGDTGVTSAKTVDISDTFLNTLDGIDLTHVGSLNINNNRQLTKFASSLEDLSDTLNIQANGIGLNVSLPNLVWIANMTIANVSDFSVPALEVVNGSARFDSNYFESFIAPNLTSTKSGDISFVGNAALTNISVPAMTKIGGGLLIANNTALHEITGFPKVKAIFGAVKLRGNFSSVAFPALNDVRGAFDVSSTNDIQKSCQSFSKIAPSKDGGNGKIQGTYKCESNNKQANEDTDGDTSGGSGDDDNAAAGVVINRAILSLAIVGGLVALL